MTLHLLDWVVVGVYAVVVLTIGLYLVKKPKTSEGYFLANRRLRWPFIGTSLFASNISAEHIVGLAGSGFAIGLAAGGFEWMAIFCMLPLIILFLPFYMSTKIYTVPEFLERRFSPGVRTMFSAVMVVLSVLTKISVSLWASSVVFHSLFGWDSVVSMWVVALITAAYTMKGGLSAVVYTDAIQTTVLLVAAVILTGIGFREVGGWSGLHSKVALEHFEMVKPITHADVPWLGMFVGVFLAGSFYWSMDQVLVQRVFAARDLNEGRKGIVLCAFLKVLTPFLLVLPGLMARALYMHEIKAPDQAYPILLKHLMPTGLLGLTVAGVAAALMGHLSATFNSIATMFTRDFYLKFRPQAEHGKQILAGRIAVLSVAILGALWAPIIGGFNSLWIYLQSVGVYLVMPFVAVFFLGVLWKRITTEGVWASVIAGFVIGPIMLFDAQMHFIPFIANTPILRPWLNAAILEFLACTAVLVGVSLFTARTAEAQVAQTTIGWGAAKAASDEPKPSWFHDYRTWLAVVVLLTTTLWFWLRNG